MTKEIFFIGVDVGSGSVRAALVDDKGHVLNASVKEIKTWKPKIDYYEQSSNDIWECCELVIKVSSLFLVLIIITLFTKCCSTLK